MALNSRPVVAIIHDDEGFVSPLEACSWSMRRCARAFRMRKRE